ncbi:MAG: class I SAM-dependent methyltransferase [Acidimicrobiales bacterium]
MTEEQRAPGAQAGRLAGEGESPLSQVLAEIDDEVRRRRREIPARLERELDAMFLEYSPMGSRFGDLGAALRMLDAAVFIDPVVPVDSERPAGALVKKGLRSVSLWYVGYVTHQVSKFATAVSRTLHLVDNQLQEIRRALPPSMPAPVVAAGDASSWWTTTALDALGGVSGRVLHAACGDGWMVRALAERGADAYGVDPRADLLDAAASEGADLREDALLDHLRSVGRGALGGLCLSGVVEGMAPAERAELVSLVGSRLDEDAAVLVVHSLTLSAWLADDAPVEADLAPGRPLRPATWGHLLSGWSVAIHDAPSGSDYLLVATR